MIMLLFSLRALILSSVAFLGFADDRAIILRSVNSAGSSPCGGMVIGVHGADKPAPSDGQEIRSH